MKPIKHGGCIDKRLNGRSSKEYAIWDAMKQRCYNKNNKRYNNYGGRGIKVCDKWLESFSNFLSDMGAKPENHSIDRIDNNGDYSPENCRWASISVQNRNTRLNHLITHNGETLCLAEWSERVGISSSTLYKRIYKRKWSIEDSVSKPSTRRRYVA